MRCELEVSKVDAASLALARPWMDATLAENTALTFVRYCWHCEILRWPYQGCTATSMEREPLQEVGDTKARERCQLDLPLSGLHAAPAPAKLFLREQWKLGQCFLGPLWRRQPSCIPRGSVSCPCLIMHLYIIVIDNALCRCFSHAVAGQIVLLCL